MTTYTGFAYPSVTLQYTDPATLYHNNKDAFQKEHKTVFNHIFEQYLGKINNSALQLLDKERQPVLGLDPCPGYGRCTYIDNSVNVYGGYRAGNGNDDAARALCALGALTLIAASAVFGYCYGNYLNTQDEIREKDRFGGYLNQFNIDPHVGNGIPCAHLNLIKDIFRNYSELLAKRLDRDKINCYTAVVLIASGGVLAVGGAVGSLGAMYLGGAALVVTVAYSAFRLVLECRRDDTKQLVGDITRQYEVLKRVGLS